MRAAQSILQFTQACLLQKMLGILLCWPQGGAMLAKGFMKMRATATATRCRSNPRNKDAVVAKVAAQAVARAEVAATAEDAGLALQHRRQRQNAAMRHQKNQQAGSRSSQSKSAQGKLTSLLNLRRKRLTSRRTLAKKQATRSRNAAQMWQALRRNDQRIATKPHAQAPEGYVPPEGQTWLRVHRYSCITSTCMTRQRP